MSNGVGMNLTIEELRAIHEAGVEIDPIFWYSNQLAAFDVLMFNCDARPMSGPETPFRDNVFVRGDSPWHQPAGRVMSWRKAVRLSRIYPDLWWAMVKPVKAEIRCYVVGDRYAYRQALPRKKLGHVVPATRDMRGIVDVVRATVPHLERLVIDITKDGRIIELNPFDACGLYGRPLPEGMRSTTNSTETSNN